MRRITLLRTLRPDPPRHRWADVRDSFGVGRTERLPLVLLASTTAAGNDCRENGNCAASHGDPHNLRCSHRPLAIESAADEARAGVGLTAPWVTPARLPSER